MNKIVTLVSKKSDFIGMILLFAAAGFVAITDIAGIGGGFMPVVGNLLIFFFDLVLLGAVPLLLALKKQQYVKYALAPLACYWMISSVLTYLGYADNATAGMSQLSITTGVFGFFIGCALLASLILAFIYGLKKSNKCLQVAYVVLVASLLFFLLVWVLRLAMYAKYDLGWDSYIGAFAHYLFLPAGLYLVLLRPIYARTAPQGAEEAPAVQNVPSEDAEDDSAEDAMIDGEENAQ